MMLAETWLLQTTAPPFPSLSQATTMSSGWEEGGALTFLQRDLLEHQELIYKIYKGLIKLKSKKKKKWKQLQFH